MTDSDRIAALEARLAAVEARIAQLEARPPVITPAQPLGLPFMPPTWPPPVTCCDPLDAPGPFGGSRITA